MPIKLKEGVDVSGVSPELTLGVQIVDPIFAQYGVECVVTSLTDGEHGVHSLHRFGYAADLRTRQLQIHQIEAVALGMRGALGAQWDVVVESDHIHMEFDPR